jgi:hypothetical protein
MRRLWSRLFPESRGPRTPRRTTPELSRLEDRCLLLAVPTANAVPELLFPPDGRLVPVTVTGTVIQLKVPQNLPRPRVNPIARFFVIDEYRRTEPGGFIHLVPKSKNAWKYSFTVDLPASRSNSDTSGRHYSITVVSEDQDGANGQTIDVLVPHDKSQLDPKLYHHDFNPPKPKLKPKAKAAAHPQPPKASTSTGGLGNIFSKNGLLKF